MTRYDKNGSGIGKTLATLVLCALITAGCSKESPADREEQTARFEVVGIGLAEKQQQTAAPATRAVAGSDGGTSFTHGDRMSLFLRGEKYTSVDNRKVTYSKPSSEAGTWVVDGKTIWLSDATAVASLVYPYSASAALDNIPLTTGPYDVQTRDVVWKQQQVYANVHQMEVTDMEHALARIKIVLKRDDPNDQTITDRYTRTGNIASVTLDNGTAAGSGSNAAVFTAGKLDMTAASPVRPVTGTTAGAITDNTRRTLTTEGSTIDLLALPVAAMAENLVMLQVNVDGTNMTKSLPFAAPADKWEAGKCYTYTVTVKNTQVVFDKVVTTAWNGGADLPGDMEEQVTIGAFMNGGIVYWIDPDDPQHYKVISLYEPSGMTWAEAGTWCESQGQNWIFPTQSDLTDIYNARKNHGGANDLTASWIDRGIVLNDGTAIGTGAYWSATETTTGGNNAQNVTLATGGVTSQAKSTRLAVRAIQELPIPIDLSAGGTANCYIASTAAKFYKFDARVKGNGKATLKVDDPDVWVDQRARINPDDDLIAPKPLAPASAFVIWSTGNSLDAIVKNVKIREGYVCFTATGLPGNALIGVKDADGALIWSWHIWATYTPGDMNYTTRKLVGDGGATHEAAVIPTPSRSFRMMDRNLGALNNTPGSPESLGLQYQWGRKDPFPSAKTTTSPDERTPFTNSYPTQNADDYGWTVTQSNSTGSGAAASIAYAIQHPTDFITPSSTTTDDWLNVRTIPEQRDYLWGNPKPTVKKPNTLAGSKSIYDPCPPGYRVPRHDSWTSFSTSNTGIGGSVNATTATFNDGTGFKFYCHPSSKNYASYYPVTGVRYKNGCLIETDRGNCWSSSPRYGGSQFSGNLNFSSRGVSSMGDSSRNYGMAVRCARE